MFHQFPVCVAFSSNDTDDGTKQDLSPRTIGAHEDTVPLLKTLFPNDNIIATPRASKLIHLLVNGQAGGGKTSHVVPLEGMLPGNRGNGGTNRTTVSTVFTVSTTLGYGQVVFAPDEILYDDRREVVQALLQALASSLLRMVVRHSEPEEAVEHVIEAQKRLLDNADDLSAVDHWYRISMETANQDYDAEMTILELAQRTRLPVDSIVLVPVTNSPQFSRASAINALHKRACTTPNCVLSILDVDLRVGPRFFLNALAFVAPRTSKTIHLINKQIRFHLLLPMLVIESVFKQSPIASHGILHVLNVFQ